MVARFAPASSARRYPSFDTSFIALTAGMIQCGDCSLIHATQLRVNSIEPSGLPANGVCSPETNGLALQPASGNSVNNWSDCWIWSAVWPGRPTIRPDETFQP